MNGRKREHIYLAGIGIPEERFPAGYKSWVTPSGFCGGTLDATRVFGLVSRLYRMSRSSLKHSEKEKSAADGAH